MNNINVKIRLSDNIFKLPGIETFDMPSPLRMYLEVMVANPLRTRINDRINAPLTNKLNHNDKT